MDRESNYLVHSIGETSGTVLLLADTEPITRELNQKTRQSTRFAVVVLHPEHKPAARAHFQTPLIFPFRKPKGLEYDNIILYNFTSAAEERFREITRGVSAEDVLAEDLRYARAREKGDKSLEIYKFHINALYVAVTRAVENLYLIEANPGQRLFEVLGLKRWEERLALAEHGSKPGRMAAGSAPAGAAREAGTGRRDPHPDPQAQACALGGAARRDPAGTGAAGLRKRRQAGQVAAV